MTTYSILKIFSVIGVLDTIYLMYHKVRGTDVACIGFPKRWCQKVQYSPQSATFGIPNSVAGFLMYSLILLFVVVGGSAVTLWPVLILVAVGFLFSLYFMFVQAFVLRAFCTWCVISFINFTVMAWALFIR